MNSPFGGFRAALGRDMSNALEDAAQGLQKKVEEVG